jgi:3-methyladenine DNA glycosylase Mpg
MHWCANIVCAREGVAEAVLLRALAPLDGIDLIREARGSQKKDRDLLSGPARLCQGLRIDGSYDGADLVTRDRGIVLLDDRVDPPAHPDSSGRVGIRVGTEFPWRFWVPGDPNVSRVAGKLPPTLPDGALPGGALPGVALPGGALPGVALPGGALTSPANGRRRTPGNID